MANQGSKERRKARIAVVKELRKQRPDMSGVFVRSVADAVIKQAVANAGTK